MALNRAAFIGGKTNRFILLEWKTEVAIYRVDIRMYILGPYIEM